MIKGLFKTSKPKQFGYKPVFYDERKERLEERKKSILSESEGASIQKGNLSSTWRKQSTGSSSKASNKRVFIIALILAVAAYLYLNF